MNTTMPPSLIPAIIQDSQTRQVLMLGYMTEDTLQQTRETGLVTFFSRSKNRVWVKGESSGNFLHVESIQMDCDQDTLLIKVKPAGPVCHTGQDTCFGENNSAYFLDVLQNLIEARKQAPPASSYTASLLASGIPKIAQKVGEEALETVIEAVAQNEERFIYESADLLFHFLVLLSAKGYSLDDVVAELQNRHTSHAAE